MFLTPVLGVTFRLQHLGLLVQVVDVQLVVVVHGPVSIVNVTSHLLVLPPLLDGLVCLVDSHPVVATSVCSLEWSVGIKTGIRHFSETVTI